MIKKFIDWIARKIFGDMYYNEARLNFREGVKKNGEKDKKVDDE